MQRLVGETGGGDLQVDSQGVNPEKLSQILCLNNAIADHLTHQVHAAGGDLVIWAREEEEATSTISQAVLTIEAYQSYRCFATMYAKLLMICEECFQTIMK